MAEIEKPIQVKLDPEPLERVNNLMTDPLFRALRAVLGRGILGEEIPIGILQIEINGEFAKRGFTLMDLDIAHKVADGTYILIPLPLDK